MSSAKKPLPFYVTFTAGAIAGVSEILTFYPLDVVSAFLFFFRIMRWGALDKKNVDGNLYTFSRSRPACSLNVANLRPAFSDPSKPSFAKKASGVSIAVSSLHYCSKHPSVQQNCTAANDFWGKSFKKLSGETEMTRQLSIITGCSAGATESFVVVPFELVKIKLQDKSLASTYNGPIDVVRQIVRKGGILGLYAGMEATFWRQLWWNGGYFGSIFQVKSMLPKAETPQGELLNNFASGSVGGFVGTVINTPYVKSYLHLRAAMLNSLLDSTSSSLASKAAEKSPGVIPKYNWTYPALVTVFREEGPAALYKGFVPKVLRLAPGGGVLLLVVEFTMGVFRKALGPPYI
ncbi:mitochondrial carrier domain-containing protein [Lactarius pseudohatsudake]|nr:mitochondrial carrier domain-containing protein [Lactarius pseudohatsudake]